MKVTNGEKGAFLSPKYIFRLTIWAKTLREQKARCLSIFAKNLLTGGIFHATIKQKGVVCGARRHPPNRQDSHTGSVLRVLFKEDEQDFYRKEQRR